jgi:hypothetical protein
MNTDKTSNTVERYPLFDEMLEWSYNEFDGRGALKLLMECCRYAKALEDRTDDEDERQYLRTARFNFQSIVEEILDGPLHFPQACAWL